MILNNLFAHFCCCPRQNVLRVDYSFPGEPGIAHSSFASSASFEREPFGGQMTRFSTE